MAKKKKSLVRDLFDNSWTTQERLEEIEKNQESIRNSISDAIDKFNTAEEALRESTQTTIMLLQRIEVHSSILQKELEKRGKLR